MTHRCDTTQCVASILLSYDPVETETPIEKFDRFRAEDRIQVVETMAYADIYLGATDSSSAMNQVNTRPDAQVDAAATEVMHLLDCTIA